MSFPLNKFIVKNCISTYIDGNICINYIYDRKKSESVTQIIRSFLETKPRVIIIIPLSIEELNNLNFVEAFYGLEKPHAVQFSGKHTICNYQEEIYISLYFLKHNRIRLQVIYDTNTNHRFQQYRQNFAPNWFEKIKNLIIKPQQYNVDDVFINFHNKLVNINPKIMAEFIVPQELLVKLNDNLYFDKNGITYDNLVSYISRNNENYHMTSLFPSCTNFNVVCENTRYMVHSIDPTMFTNCTKLNIVIRCRELVKIIELCELSTTLYSLSLNVFDRISDDVESDITNLLNKIASNTTITKLNILSGALIGPVNMIPCLESYFKTNKTIEVFKFNMAPKLSFIFPCFSTIINSSRLRKLSFFPNSTCHILDCELMGLLDRSIDVSSMTFYDFKHNEIVQQYKKFSTKLQKIAF